MPTTYDRKVFKEAISKNHETQIRALLQRDDAKELLLMKYDSGDLPIHDACWDKVDKAALQLILDAAVKHGIAKEILEATTNNGSTCLHYACVHDLSANSIRLLLQYLSKHADFEKVLEEKEIRGQNCLHYASYHKLSIYSLRLLISFFPSKDVCGRVLDARDYRQDTPADLGSDHEAKQLLRDPHCFEKCRLWLLRNQEDTFLYSLFPYSFDQTSRALKELTLKNVLQHSQQHATIILISLMASPSKFREAVDETTTSAPMSSYFDVVKNGDQKSDYNHWRKNIRLFREFYGQLPPSNRRTASTYEGEDSSSCSIQ